MIGRFIKPYLHCLIVFFILIVTACLILFSDEQNILKYKERLSFICLLLGWYIAFTLVIIQINKNRRDNKELKKREIKKSLQIEAFKQINLSITESSKIFTGIQIDFLMIVDRLKNLSKNSNFDFQSFIFPFYSKQYSVDLNRGFSIYKRAVEANEIAVIEFSHFDKKIFLEVHRLSNLIGKFGDFVGGNSQQSLLSQNLAELDRKSNEISRLMLDIQCYLHDFRIVLMNHFLEDVFDATVPMRKLNDNKNKTLIELAGNKHEVEKEFEMLEKSLTG